MSTKMAHTHLLIDAALLCAPAIARADQLVDTDSFRFPNFPAGRCTMRVIYTGASRLTELSKQLPAVRSCTGNIGPDGGRAGVARGK